jgi:multicomponent Na+:H+ antiporter subunit F
MIDLLLTLLIGSFTTSVILASYRFIRGPTIPDRMLALDIMTYSLVVVIAIVAVMLGSPYLIVVSFSLALWFFIGSLYVARYLEGEAIGD